VSIVVGQGAELAHQRCPTLVVVDPCDLEAPMCPGVDSGELRGNPSAEGQERGDMSGRYQALVRARMSHAGCSPVQDSVEVR